MKFREFCLFLCCFVSVYLLSSCLSCKMDTPMLTIWGGDIVSPKLLSVMAESENTISVEFSLPVSIAKASIRLEEEECSVTPEVQESSRSIRLIMSQGPQAGREAILCATVIDSGGNTLSFAVPFTGYNNRVPRLHINEVRCVYAKPKVEYIEFLVLSNGNLGGVEICNPGNISSPVWKFPPSEVIAGDYIVYHLRSIEENLINETDEVLATGTESAGIDASSPARDFWDDQSKAPLKKTAVILVRERSGGAIMDAFLMCEPEKTAWPSKELLSAAEEACSVGAWGPTALVTDAVSSMGTTATRTIGRDSCGTKKEDTNTAEDWLICPTSKASPGADNYNHPLL